MDDKNKDKNNLEKRLKNRQYFLWLAVFLLIFANAYSVYDKFYDEKKVLEKIKEKYPKLSPAMELYDKDDLIVNIQPLRDELNKIGEDPAVSIYFEFLNTGANISVNKDMSVWPASLMKIPIAMAVMKKIEKGEWSMDSELVLYQEDKDDRFGVLYEKPTGSRFTIKGLLGYMLIDSDNTARTVFMRNLDKENIDEVLEHLGIEDIFNSDNQVSAKKYSILWRSLYTASYLSAENSQQLIEIMAKSNTNTYLSLGIPEKIFFSHKIGVIYEDNVYADSGIVYVPNRPYVITVMMQGHSQEESEKIIKDISKKVYDYVSNY